MPKFRKKPVVIEAIQFTGKNAQEVLDFIGESHVVSDNCVRIAIKASDGYHRLANVDDWVVKGIAGEFCLCKPEIFADTYEPVPGDRLKRMEELAKEISLLAVDYGYSVCVTLNPLVECPREIGGGLIVRSSWPNFMCRTKSIKPSE